MTTPVPDEVPDDQTPEQTDNSARPEDGEQALSQDPDVAYVNS